MARRPLSSIHASTSNPCGLTVPCGRFSRTTRRQRSPAAMSGTSSVVPSLRTCAYQASDRRAGTIARGVSVRSTARTKRVPRAESAGGRRRRRRARYRRPPTRKAARRRVGPPRASPRSRSPAAPAASAASIVDDDACDERFAGESPQRDRERRRDDRAAQPRRSRRQLGPPLQPHDTGGERRQRQRQHGRTGRHRGVHEIARGCWTPRLSRGARGSGGCVEQRRAGSVKLPACDRSRHSSNGLAEAQEMTVLHAPSARAPSACSGKARSACRRRAG